MSFEPNLAAPEPRLLTWRWKNLRLGSGRQRRLSRPRVLPASLGPLLSGRGTALGRTRIAAVSPRWPFPLPSISVLARLQAGRAVSGLPRTQCELRSGRCRWGPGLEPSGPCGEGTPGLHLPSPLPPPQSKTAGPNPSFLSSSCGHLVLCLALRRVHRVKTFWPFLF